MAASACPLNQRNGVMVSMVGSWLRSRERSRVPPLPASRSRDSILYIEPTLTEESPQGVRPPVACLPVCQVDRMRLQPASCAMSVAKTADDRAFTLMFLANYPIFN